MNMSLLGSALLFSTQAAFASTFGLAQSAALENNSIELLKSEQIDLRERDYAQVPTSSQFNFSDVSTDYWANPYLSALSNLGVISGFPDGTFRPSQLVTRAEFAAILNKAFPQPPGSGAIAFKDVPEDYWAADAIQSARANAFLAGYPGNLFRPQQPIPRVQAIVALASGLNYSQSDTRAIDYFTDARSIPQYALQAVAGATEASAVVNYPTLDELNPNREATRAEVAAFVYQSMVKAGIAQPLNEPPRLFVAKPDWKLKPIARIEEKNALALSLSESGDRLLTVKPTALQVWDIQSGDRLGEVVANDEFTVESATLNRTGTQIAAIVQDSKTSGLQLRLWSAETGESAGWRQPLEPSEKNSLAVPSFSTVFFGATDDTILTQVAVSSEFALDYALKLHDSETGQVIETLEPSGGRQVPRVAFSPNGELIAIAATAR